MGTAIIGNLDYGDFEKKGISLIITHSPEEGNRMRYCRLLSLSFVFLVALSSAAFAYGRGISGFTLKGNAAGCAFCHSSATKNATLTLKVPAAFKVSETRACTVLVAGSTTGIDIAAFSGTLAPVGTRTKAVTNGELTHPSAGTGVYAFTYTAPATPGTDTLYATGVSGGFTGSWNHAPKFTITISALTSIDEQGPIQFSLAQNFPNPFNPSTTIAYSLPTASKVVLTVFDISGRVVRTLVNETQAAGTYRATLNADGLASGVYIYRLAAGNQIAARKLVLLK
jgi:hypothetical protein